MGWWQRRKQLRRDARIQGYMRMLPAGLQKPDAHVDVDTMLLSELTYPPLARRILDDIKYIEELMSRTLEYIHDEDKAKNGRLTFDSLNAALDTIEKLTRIRARMLALVSFSSRSVEKP